MRVEFPYDHPAIASAEIPDERLLGVFGPEAPAAPSGSVEQLVAEALRKPIESPPLGELVGARSRVVLLVDDITRSTPVDRMLPPVLDELNRAGVPDQRITGLIALGTHRAMTDEEIELKYGPENTRRIGFVNHAWNDPRELTHIGRTQLGFDMMVNRRVAEADLTIGFGHIVPHDTAGFSGGGKILMPGVSGEVTLSQTHWASLDIPLQKLLGWRDNPVRMAIDEIGRQAGLRFIVNVVPRPDASVQAVFCGDPVAAHRQGCKLASQIYGVRIPARADIVVVDSAPSDIDLRQAIKGIVGGSLAARPDGVVVLVTPCPEGVAPQFPEYEQIGFLSKDEMEPLIQRGKISRIGAYSLVLIGELLRQGLSVVLASPGVQPDVARGMRFDSAPGVQAAIDHACTLRPDGRVLVLHHGSEALPIVDGQV